MSICLVGAEKVDDLRELWLALHRHHRQTARQESDCGDEDLRGEDFGEEDW